MPSSRRTSANLRRDQLIEDAAAEKRGVRLKHGPKFIPAEVRRMYEEKTLRPRAIAQGLNFMRSSVWPFPTAKHTQGQNSFSP